MDAISVTYLTACNAGLVSERLVSQRTKQMDKLFGLRATKIVRNVGSTGVLFFSDMVAENLWCGTGP